MEGHGLDYRRGPALITRSTTHPSNFITKLKKFCLSLFINSKSVLIFGNLDFHRLVPYSAAKLWYFYYIHRGFYMVALRYKISLRVLKNISTQEEKFCISKQPCSVLYIIF